MRPAIKRLQKKNTAQLLLKNCGGFRFVFLSFSDAAKTKYIRQ